MLVFYFSKDEKLNRFDLVTVDHIVHSALSLLNYTLIWSSSEIELDPPVLVINHEVSFFACHRNSLR